MAAHIWLRFAGLPLTTLEKGKIYAVIKDSSLDELSTLFPPFLDDATIAVTLRTLCISPQERPAGVADWGSPSTQCMAPSSFNNALSKSLQQQQERPAVANFRPAAACPKLPLQLAHPAFGAFVDIFRGSPGAVQPGKDDYEFYAKLAAAYSKFYDEASEYRPKVRELWVDYTGLALQQEMFTGHTNESRSSATATDVGYALEDIKALVTLMEAKLSMCGTGTDPAMQATQNYRLYWAKVGDEYRFSGTCYPALVIEHIGPFIRASAIANLDVISFQPLTPFINCLLLHRHDLLAAEEGARLCLAAKVTLLALQDFYLDSFKGLVPQVQRPLFSSGTPYPLHFERATPTRWGEKLVYLLPELNTVVKYVQGRYGEDVHRAWADAGYAPRLLKPVTPVPGGWLEVRMEYLGEGWKVLQSVEEAEKLRPRVLEALARAHQVPVGASVGAHGDMRDINTMVRVDGETVEIKFIDFDWSCEQGCAVYPSFMNHSGVRWPESASSGRPVLQEHDTTLLAGSTIRQDESTSSQGVIELLKKIFQQKKLPHSVSRLIFF